MSYEYKRPKGELYKVSIKKWNQTFAHRGRWPFVVAEVYLQEDVATIQYVVSVCGKILFWVLSPLYYIVVPFIVGFKEAHEDFKCTVFDKNTGSFDSDVIYKSRGSSDWKRLLSLVGRNGDETISD